MPRRIRRPNDFSSLMDKLAGSDESLFETYADLLIFTASLGFHHGRRKAFKQVAGQIPYTTFENRASFPTVINCIALGAKNDLSILKDENSDDRLTLFEEYACGGLEIVSSKLESGFLPKDAVIDLCTATQDKSNISSTLLDEYDLDL